MSTTPNSRLLEKVRALLNKAGDRGVTPEESQVFFAKATELLTKHGLSTADLDSVKGSTKADYGIRQTSVSMNRQQHEADDYIWPILNECFGVKTLYTHSYEGVPLGGKPNFAWILVGDETQILLASLAAEIIYRTMTSSCRKFLKTSHLAKTAQLKRSFYAGVKRGYIDKHRETQAEAYAEATKGQADAYGLVLQGKAEAIVSYVAEVIKPVFKKAPDVKLDHRTFFAGVTVGASMDLNSANKLA